jgi:hypothetical protein
MNPRDDDDALLSAPLGEEPRHVKVTHHHKIRVPNRPTYKHLEDIRLAAGELIHQIDMFIRGFKGEIATREEVGASIRDLLDTIDDPDNA